MLEARVLIHTRDSSPNDSTLSRERRVSRFRIRRTATRRSAAAALLGGIDESQEPGIGDVGSVDSRLHIRCRKNLMINVVTRHYEVTGIPRPARIVPVYGFIETFALTLLFMQPRRISDLQDI
jgi:hypothetical protein